MLVVGGIRQGIERLYLRFSSDFSENLVEFGYAGSEEEGAKMDHVGEMIRRRRGQLGWTQEELAEKAGVAASTLVRIENGEAKRPRAGTLSRLTKVLGISPEELREAAQLPAKRPEPVEAAGVGTFTAVYELTEDGWWVVSVPEIPGAHSQGQTLEEAREMIRDAVRMLLKVRREDAEREVAGKKNVVREPLEV